ncbi:MULTISPECIES: DUF934 domain-containing protein [Acinetobacter]|jgi:uncharacterized protein (DUF934 family)|uniref:DUF934 domain-containing protein n=1 Tax=Acinetobacter TaxID=469 RepID=UPI0002D060BE|nr:MULTISPECIES: DUF934 domain-containing protein [Acinetobacter]ENU61791.1 hypothetical protein F980_02518 [Acinetobacter lwoffii NIPH 715]MCO8079674.1 DUF934 domain-containing protein [Acinetobacter lwoffii]OIU85681.1 hypothetical protein BFN00_01500 [Acinetobacter sp. AR2-3]UHT63856.1 hypothetical protein ABEDC_0617 [Acinetobacter lwoffii]UVA99967.1 hypothetical protein ABWED_0649 [Acinetobacter lwoffii]
MLNTALQVLSKDGTIADNTYQLVGEDGVLPQGDVVLTVEQLDQIANISGKKALYLTVDASPENHEFPLDQLDAIFIEFAGFNDGRGYSFAALLRRQGFQGELRATGDVFKDVLNYMKRSGFDTFVIKEGKDIQEAAAGLNDFRNPYQASTAVAQAHYQTGA